MKTVLKHGPYTYYNLYDGPWGLNLNGFAKSNLAEKIKWYHSLMSIKPLAIYPDASEFGPYLRDVYQKLALNNDLEVSTCFSLQDFGLLPIFSDACYSRERMSFTCREVHPDKYILTCGDMIMELDRTNEPEVPVGRLLKSPEAYISNSDFKFLGKEPLAPGAEVEFFRHWMDCWVEVRDLHKIKDFYESQIDLLVAYLFERDLDLDLTYMLSPYCWNAAMGKWGAYDLWLMPLEEEKQTNMLLCQTNFDQYPASISAMDKIQCIYGFLKITRFTEFQEHFSKEQLDALENFIQSNYLLSWREIFKTSFYNDDFLKLESAIYMGDYQHCCVLRCKHKRQIFFISRQDFQSTYPDLDELTVGMPVRFSGRNVFHFLKKGLKRQMLIDAHHYFDLVRNELKRLDMPLNLGIVYKAIV